MILLYCSKEMSPSHLMHLENRTGRAVIVGVRLLVEFDPLARHRRICFSGTDGAKGLDEVIDVWHEVTYCVGELALDLHSECLRHEVIGQVECHFLIQVVNHVESQYLEEEVLGSLMLAFFVCSPGTLEEESLTKGQCQILNIFVALEHPDLVEFALFVEDLGLHDLSELFDLETFPHEHHVAQVLHAHYIRLLQVSQFLPVEHRSIMSILLRVRKDVLNDLLHEHFVVTLSRHATVGTEQCVTNEVLSKEGGTTAPLSGDPGYLLGLPAHHGFHNAACLDDPSLGIRRRVADVLSKQLLRTIVTEVQYDSARNQGKYRVLLKLEAHDGCVRKSTGSDC